MKEKFGVTSIILRRLEVFWLEEWIDHYLSIGFEKIVLYDNGTLSIDDGIYSQGARQLTSEEINCGKWKKKPDAEYFEEFSDEYISNKLKEIKLKYEGILEVIPWECKKNHDYDYPLSQRQAFRHCFENYPEYWWACFDPDEFLVMLKDKDIQSLRHRYSKANCLQFKQRIFEERKKGVPAKKNINWGYDCEDRHECKVMCRGPVDTESKWALYPHSIKPQKCILRVFDKDIARINHYRGNPAKSGKDGYSEVYINNGKPLFNKIDNSINE